MNEILRHQVKIAIDRLKETNFQRFVDQFFIKKCGTGYTPIKPKRDKGCDGILDNCEILAVYAPEKYSLKVFKTKTKSDHDEFVKNWKSKYPKWCVVFNGEFTAEMFTFLDDLENGCRKIGINQLLDDIGCLEWVKIREILEYLGMDQQYFINDLLQNVINDLLKNSYVTSQETQSRKPIYIEEKIELNFDSEDVENAKNDYLNSLGTMVKLKDILKIYNDDEIAALKGKIINDYGKLAGDFKTRFNNLTETLSGNQSNDQQYVYYVRVVLLYMFESCLIGTRLEGEP